MQHAYMFRLRLYNNIVKDDIICKKLTPSFNDFDNGTTVTKQSNF